MKNIAIIYCDSLKNDTDRRLKDVVEKYINLLVSHIICWPLIAACSIVRKDSNSKFAPEYVIPQMLLQWVMEYEDDNGKIDGIRYFSAKKTNYLGPIKSIVNYVFPAIKSPGDRDYSSMLAEKFEISAPIRLTDVLFRTLFKNAEAKLRTVGEISETNLQSVPVKFRLLSEILSEYNNRKQ